MRFHRVPHIHLAGIILFFDSNLAYPRPSLPRNAAAAGVARLAEQTPSTMADPTKLESVAALTQPLKADGDAEIGKAASEPLGALRDELSPAATSPRTSAPTNPSTSNEREAALEKLSEPAENSKELKKNQRQDSGQKESDLKDSKTTQGVRGSEGAEPNNPDGTLSAAGSTQKEESFKASASGAGSLGVFSSSVKESKLEDTHPNESALPKDQSSGKESKTKSGEGSFNPLVDASGKKEKTGFWTQITEKTKPKYENAKQWRSLPSKSDKITSDELEKPDGNVARGEIKDDKTTANSDIHETENMKGKPKNGENETKSKKELENENETTDGMKKSKQNPSSAAKKIKYFFSNLFRKFWTKMKGLWNKKWAFRKPKEI